MPRDNRKARRIILALLHHPEGTLTKYRIAKETGSNISWVIHTLRKLEKDNLIQKTKVLNVDQLIDRYLSLDTRMTSFDFHIPEPLAYLKNVKSDYALTTYAAENLTSHHLFPSRIDVYIKEKDAEEWKHELFAKGLIGKGNLRLIIPSDDYIFKFTQTIKKLRVVTLPLLMIDLKREGGVCMQAYEYLVKHVSR